MRKYAPLLLLPICALSMNATFANTEANSQSTDTHWNHHTGLYAEGDIGTNLYYLGIFSSAGTFSHEGFLGWGWGAALGYNFNYHWALEGGFIQSYATFETAENHSEYTNANVPYLVARYTLPIKNNFSFLFKLGAAYADVNLKDKTVGKHSSPNIVLPFTGIGMAYAITPKLDLTVQYQGFVYGIASAGLVSTGLTYHFS